MTNDWKKQVFLYNGNNMYKKRSPKALALHKQEKEHFGSRLKCNIIFIFFQWVAYENNFLQRH